MSKDRIKSALSVSIEQVQQWQSREETQANKRLHELKARQNTLENQMTDLQILEAKKIMERNLP